MPNSAKTRPHSDRRFYYPPAVRRHQEQQLLLQQQHLQLQRHLQRPANVDSRPQTADSEATTARDDSDPPAVRLHQEQQLLLQRPAKVDSRPQTADSEATTARDDSDDSALSRANSLCSSPTHRANLTYMDRLVESVTPSVRAHFLPEVRARGRQIKEADSKQYFFLVDFWESFSEWSVYGVGVPLELNGSEPVKQYYVPSLSGIQLYVDQHRTSSDADSLRVPSRWVNSDYEVERRGKDGVDDIWRQLQVMNLNSRKMNGFKHPLSSSRVDEVKTGSSDNGQLVFEYYEYEKPHNRRPLYDQISLLASQFPDLEKYRSCDLSPESWVSVAWYPIYRIPVGPTLQNMDASFLTFYSLSTNSKSKVDSQSTNKLRVPVFGLASYKLRGSMLMPNSSQESHETNALAQAANDWLRSLHVHLPDYEFFMLHSSNGR